MNSSVAKWNTAFVANIDSCCKPSNILFDSIFSFHKQNKPPLPVTLSHKIVLKNTLDDNFPEIQLPQPLLQEEDGGQIRTIKYDKNAQQGITNNPLEVTGRCISEQELVAVCKYMSPSFKFY